MRYRCHTGHAFSAESLLAEQSEAIEAALFTAIRALEEKASASRNLAARFAERLPRFEVEHQIRAQQLDDYATIIRELIANHRS